MSPEFLLSLFLPVLLFASAFAIEWHTFRQVMWQALLLAFPGVIIGTGLTAVCFKYLFPYDWTWSQYLMFGAMLSATVCCVTWQRLACTHHHRTRWRWWPCSRRSGLAGHDTPMTPTPYIQVGVDKRLRIVVDGEALLNDGSAYVLFLLFQVWLLDRQPALMHHASRRNLQPVKICPRVVWCSCWRS